jgi:hypothetical protein
MGMVDGPGFKDFVKVVNPSYAKHMPGSGAFTQRAVRVWKAAIPLLAMVFLLACTWMAVSEDGWTAPGGTPLFSSLSLSSFSLLFLGVGSFSGLVGNWIGPDWEMNTSLLGCRRMKGTSLNHSFA